MFEPIPDLDYFKLLVRDPRAIPLIEAAASLGIDAYPAMDLQATVSRFDTLARDLAARCRNDTTEVARLQSLIFFFYEEMGFSGNVNDYYNPDNSYLHRVLDTRRGIPITLALIFIELARHIGLESTGVAFPGHFLVRLKLSQGVVVIDPFTGKSLQRDELEQRAANHPMSLPSLMRAASSAQILTRMLYNLLAIHEQAGRADLLDKVKQRLQILETAA